MNISQMKNMIVLKDLPSNIVDEAIVILKHNVKVKNKEMAENKSLEKSVDNQNENYHFAVKEAEYIIQDYLKSMEMPKQTKNELRSMSIKYRKLQISSFLLGVTTILGIILSIIK